MASPASPVSRIAAQLALTLAIGAWAFMTLLSAVELLGMSGETKEWFLYLGTFSILLPASLLAGERALRRIAEDTRALWAASGVGIGLLALIAAARLAYAVDGGPTGTSPLFVAGLLALVAVAVIIVRRSEPAPLRELPRARAVLLAVAAATVLLAVLSFAPGWVLSAKNLVIATAFAAAASGAMFALTRCRVRRAGLLLDTLAVSAIVLVGNDLGLYENAFRFFDVTSNLHQGFYLGPANDVLHGRAMLVDTFSQYGAGVFLFLAGWFEVATIGYGSMTLISGLLSAMQVVMGYAIVRLAGGSRTLSVACSIVLLAAIFFNNVPPPTSHPSTGGLRYLLPYLLIALALRSARTGDAPGRAAVAVLACASVWSLETFTYCVAAFAGLSAWISAAGAVTLGEFARALRRPAALALLAVAGAQLAFALLTLALAGSLPAWGGYLDFLGQYDVDGISAQPMQPWSPGIAVCAIYFASLAALWLVAARADPEDEGTRPALLGIAGVAPLGLATFTYYIGNSYPDVALLVGAPAYITVALWMTLSEHHRELMGAPARVLSVGLPLLAAALVGVFTWPQINDRAPDTPLARALPGDGAFSRPLARMWRSEPVDDRYDEPARLLSRYLPGRGPALVVAYPDEAVGVLLQTGRVNLLPVAHFLQESLILHRSVPRVRAAVARLRPGGYMLAEARAFGPEARAKVPLLAVAAEALRRRFDLRFVEGDPNGFMVIQLIRR